MNKQITIKETIEGILKTIDFAVLATEDHGQPHTSLIAITPFNIYQHHVFATYRHTLKHRNIENNNRVALLLESRHISVEGQNESVVLTIIGHTEEINIDEKEAAYQAHLKHHPQMESFMLSPNCVLIKIMAISYQLVCGIDDVRWITAEELYNS